MYAPTCTQKLLKIQSPSSFITTIENLKGKKKLINLKKIFQNPLKYLITYRYKKRIIKKIKL